MISVVIREAERERRIVRHLLEVRKRFPFGGWLREHGLAKAIGLSREGAHVVQKLREMASRGAIETREVNGERQYRMGLVET